MEKNILERMKMKKVGTRKRGGGLSPEFREELRKAKAEGKDFGAFFHEQVIKLATRKDKVSKEEKQRVIEELINLAQPELSVAEAEDKYLKELKQIEEWASVERTEEEWEQLAKQSEQELRKQVRGYGYDRP